MTKFIASLCALSIYGSFGATALEGEPPLRAPDALDSKASVGSVNDQVTSSDSAAMPMGQMSDEEKERRREVCARRHDQCYDRCTEAYSTKKFRAKLQPCYVRCAEEVRDCMKEIPN